MRQGRSGIRVIGGQFRGRRLQTLSGITLRPTSDRVREALFDILGQKVVGAAWLDAYAGTGAVGIEALSRGAAKVVFVEKDPEAVDLLRRNLRYVGEAPYEVIPADLVVAIGMLANRGLGFDIIFLDPPYAGGELDRALRLVSTTMVLKPGGLLVAEHGARTTPPSPERLSAVRTVSYGSSSLTFYRFTESILPRDV
ncbi:MAG TPA: 16S rRNA (guanine(966)-N(2))-methyltransferase RsmD [Candidatus Polarisedimenticolia bacterium]|nr:16S rRNA (guanine(966)-N(2))-methyltransferase RsmD [Candidatus Polarisedimenticolia bacterium]